MKRHLEECPFTMIPCKYIGLGCDVKKKRREMVVHEKNDKQHLPIALKAVAELQEEKVILNEKIVRLENAAKLATTTFKLDNNKINYDENFETRPFYTHPGGYNMAIKIKLNDDNDESDDDNILVKVMIKRGNFDDELMWPFNGVVTITLLNQLENKHHFSQTQPVELLKPDKNVRVRDEWLDFISQSQLIHNPEENTQYLKDDTLYFRVTVEATDCKPWLECTTQGYLTT